MISFRRERHAPANHARSGPQPIYAIGDIHGRYDLLHALLGEIRRDAIARHPGVTPLLVLCGDYIDRGLSSAKVIGALTWLQRSAALEVRLLEGNHEAMLMDFLESPTRLGRWLAVDGHTTIRSYGVSIPDDIDYQSARSLTMVRDGLLDAMPTSHYTLLRNLELYVEVGDYAFVHAGVAPGVALSSQKRDDLLWIRDGFLDHPRPAKSIIVHGHTWTDDKAVVLPHRICIDTGAYKTGVLTALHIADDVLDVIQATTLNQDYDPAAKRFASGPS
jgi:serine/threonine protein phosphatase 1